MKKLILSLIFVAVVSSAAFAQKKLLTLDEIFSTDPAVRVNFSGSPVGVRWTTDGRSFQAFRDGKVVRVDPFTNAVTPFFDSARFAEALRSIGMTENEANRAANSPRQTFNEQENAILVSYSSDIWHYDTASGNIKRLTNNKDTELEADYSPDGKLVSFVRNNDLYVVDIATAKERRMTNDGSKTVFNGYLVWVYEEELYGRGNKRGYWWSPDSSAIAFLRLDDAPVPKFVIANDVVTEQVIEDANYPKAGDPNPLVRLGVADVSKELSVNFADLSKYDPKDVLVARVAWTPDAKNVVFQALNREQTFLDLSHASREGKVTNLLRETTPAWVEVHGNPRYLKDGTMLWESDRSGFKHLYHYAADGKLIRAVTNGKWEVRSIYGIDENTGWVYFSGTKDSPIAENIYRVKLSGGAVERLSEGPGTHSAMFNSSFTHYVETWSDLGTPWQTRLYKADGTLVKAIAENPVPVLDEYALSPVEYITVKTRDGFEMEAAMIKPPDFDPNKKYPVLQYTYAGPHAQSVVDRWGGSRYMWHQMLAQKGYIIWVCDNRAASGKGMESVWPSYKNFMVLELQDILDGVGYLRSLPYVDEDRIGIWGWSFGGFMTSYALTHSDAFKMGIAGGSVTDWRLYDSIYTDRYMMTPQNNPEGYDRTSALKAAANLNGSLLLIHGMIDDNVHLQNTTQFVYELQKANKQFDLMLYPNQRHGIGDPRQVRHWYTMMTDYVLENL